VKEIFCRIDRCLGCKSCEIACAVEHSHSRELVAAICESPLPKPRVRVRCVDEQGGYVRLRSLALQCRHCAEPACVDVCITGGITKDEATGIVRFDTDKCVGCWSCTMVCPFGVIIRFPTSDFAQSCDRCAEREMPACVEACPTKALVFCEPEEFDALCGKGDTKKSVVT
jgi:carbon-monoxide dehydrogenase iron sulfur subunit